MTNNVNCDIKFKSSIENDWIYPCLEVLSCIEHTSDCLLLHLSLSFSQTHARIRTHTHTHAHTHTRTHKLTHTKHALSPRPHSIAHPRCNIAATNSITSSHSIPLFPSLSNTHKHTHTLSLSLSLFQKYIHILTSPPLTHHITWHRWNVVWLFKTLYSDFPLGLQTLSLSFYSRSLDILVNDNDEFTRERENVCVSVFERERENVCVWVCVCVWKRERERDWRKVRVSSTSSSVFASFKKAAFSFRIAHFM